MSIEFSPAFDSGRSSLGSLRGPGRRPVKSSEQHAPAARATSERRRAANRRNAQRSTGPRTAAGKRRASRNALKHGLCSTYACLAGECPATYATFVRELEEELQPRTTLQRSLVPHIANLLWRIDRLPEAQAKMFEQELGKCGKGEVISASELLARRFSDDPTRNGFLLIGRYERGLHNQLHRLMARFEWLKKHRPEMPADEDERRATLQRRDAQVDAYIAECARQARERREREAQAAAERTQSNPPQNPICTSETAKSAGNSDAQVTERTQASDAEQWAVEQ
jgi:hypothetical protein